MHVRPWGHDRSHGTVGEVENALDHVALDSMDRAKSGTLRDEVVNVVFRHGSFEAWAQTQQAKEQTC